MRNCNLNFMKKLLATIVYAGLLCASDFSGGYVGGVLQLECSKSEAKYEAPRTGKVTKNSTKPGAGVFSGYGQELFGKIYLGAEAKLASDSRSGNSTNTLMLKNKPGFDFGAFARLGAVVNKSTLPYLIVGYETSSATTNLKKTNGTKITSLKNKGLAMGGGVDYLVNSKWFLRFDYRHNFNSTKSFQGNVEGANITAKIKTSSDTVGLGGGYKF